MTTQEKQKQTTNAIGGIAVVIMLAVFMLPVFCFVRCAMSVVDVDSRPTAPTPASTPKPKPQTLEQWQAMSISEWSAMSREERRHASFEIDKLITAKLIKENTEHPKVSATPDERLSDDWTKTTDKP